MRDDTSGQVLLEGLHDAHIVGMTLRKKEALHLAALLGDGSRRVLAISGEREVYVYAGGHVMPMIVESAFLNPPEDELHTLVSHYEIVNESIRQYGRENRWMVVFTATFGDGLIVSGSGLLAELRWLPESEIGY
jgi:hypothetical protein